MVVKPVCLVYFCLLISISESISSSTWISASLAQIGTKRLSQITLPGTHDSGAFHLSNILMPGDSIGVTYSQIVAFSLQVNKSIDELELDWTITQTQTIYEQMQGGMRYFDLRAGYVNTSDTWVVFHYVDGYPMKALLQDISKYLQDYPEEIVIAELSHFYGSPTNKSIADLVNIVQDTLGAYLYPYDSEFTVTVNDMVVTNRRAIVTMEQGADLITIWPPNTIYNTYADSPDINQMIRFNNATVQRFVKGPSVGNWTGNLFKVSWTLTPNISTVMDIVNPNAPQTLLQLAQYANTFLPAFSNFSISQGWRIGNILIIDYYETSQIMKVIYQMNGISFGKLLFYSFFMNFL